MQFFIFALLVAGTMAAVDPNDPKNKARAAMANRILTADPGSFVTCSADGDCKSKGAGWKCQSLMKLCSPGNSPQTDAIEGTCSSTDDCRPLYRCNSNQKCAFVGPRACTSVADCDANVAGLSFECSEHPKNAPGKRCWMKCASDDQCHGCQGNTCRVPENFRQHIKCCGGLCQRKNAC
jgi:hypothetical protein